MSVLGDKFVEFSFRKFKSGDTIDFDKFTPDSVVGRMLINLFYRFEIFKKNVTGFY